jgi:cytochrome oxidase Cu insertion factor (SCO1/SenC/PrrC family)
MRVARFAIPLAVLVALLPGCARPSTPTLVGTVMTKPVPAIDFSLIDQKGSSYSLTSSKGKVVVLSFIYTHCDDICPFVTMKLKNARDILGPLVGKVEFVAVTTDPERDRSEVNAAYSREAGLFDSWHFLTGAVADVKKVWTDFGIGVHKVDESNPTPSEGGGMNTDDMNAKAATGLSQADLALGKTIGDKFGGGYEVTHTAPFWFIDPKGNIRAVLNADASPADIVTNVKALLAGH